MSPLLLHALSLQPRELAGTWELYTLCYDVSVPLPFNQNIGTLYAVVPFSDHPNLEPRHFVDEKVVNENHKDYMFLECVLFITEVGTGKWTAVCSCFLFSDETIYVILQT